MVSTTTGCTISSSIFLPITIFFAVIFIFKMTVTFGPLNSFIFFAQMMTTMMAPEANGFILYGDVTHGWYSTLKSIYFIPYDIWNLNFFHFLTDFFCLSPELNNLDVMCLKYVEAVVSFTSANCICMHYDTVQQGSGLCCVLVSSVSSMFGSFQTANKHASITNRRHGSFYCDIVH